MPKPNKSSASSGTRKKHARKAGGPTPDLPNPNNRGASDKKLTKAEKAALKKAPKQKAYIPPKKPAPAQIDPLDLDGLKSRLPGDLVVVLRGLGKKARVTRTRSLEELGKTWIKNASAKDEEAIDALVTMIPAWVHHLPALLLHHDRRIRMLAAQTHSDLLQIPEFHQAFLDIDSERVVGPWLLAAHDPEGAVSSIALPSWSEYSGDKTAALPFITQTIFDPLETYASFNPPPFVPLPPSLHAAPKKGSKRPPPAPTPKEPEEREKEDEAESLDDRKARIRSSAISALASTLGSKTPAGQSDTVPSLLSTPAFWSSLHSEKVCPWMTEDEESFGYGQTLVRRSAWAFATSLLKHKELLQEDILPLVSVAVLRAAFVETDRGTQVPAFNTLIAFLKEFPNAWTMEASYRYGSDDDDEESGSESGEEDETAKLSVAANEESKSQAYDDFLGFLQLGCNGAPTTGYPIIVLILDSIPRELLQVERLFTSLYSALPARALAGAGDTGKKAGNAWVRAIVECVVLISRKHAQIVDMHVFPAQHIVSLWEEMAEEGRVAPAQDSDEDSANQVKKSYKLVVDEQLVAKDLAWAIATVGLEHYKPAWSKLDDAISEKSFTQPRLVCRAIRAMSTAFRRSTNTELPKAVNELKIKLVQRGVAAFQSEDNTEQHRQSIDLLAAILETFGGSAVLAAGAEVVERLDETVFRQSPSIFSSTASSIFKQLLVVYLNHRSDDARCNTLWSSLLQATKSLDALRTLASLSPIPVYLRPKGGELDRLIGALVERVLNGQSDAKLALYVLEHSEHFLSEGPFLGIIESLVGTFTGLFQSTLKLHPQNIDTSTIGASLALLQPVLCGKGSRNQELQHNKDIIFPLLPLLFVAGWLAPERRYLETQARAMFSQWSSQANDTLKETVQATIVATLASYLSDVSISIPPEDIILLFSDSTRPTFLTADVIIKDLLPTEPVMFRLLMSLPSSPADSSLAVLDPLIPPSALAVGASRVPNTLHTVSPYDRLIRSFVCVLYHDRVQARGSLWILRHLISHELYSQDWLAVRKDLGIFGPDADASQISSVLDKTKVLTAYMLHAALADAGDSWRSGLVEALSQNKEAAQNPLSDFSLSLIQRSAESDTIREARVVSIVLSRLFEDVEAREAEKWMAYAKSIENSAPHISNALVYAITHTGSEPTRLDRYRNELAASLLGIHPGQSRTLGTKALWRLAMSVPSSDSEVVLIPQQRAINVMKACQGWIVGGDDDDDDDDGDDDGGELESVMTTIFAALVPILQSLPGNHWDFIFDVIENNLENCSLADSSSLVSLARTLKLIAVIQDLASTNKSLRSDWQSRELAILKLVRDLAAATLPEELGISTPRSTCRELVLNIVQQLPPSLVDSETLAKMAHLLADPSAHVQSLAYQLLQTAAHKRTEHLIVEAAVDTEGTFTAELPPELVQMLQVNLELAETGHDYKSYGHLLTWMVTFDLFHNASFKVRLSYISQIRQLDLIWLHFIPNIFGLLGLDRTSKPFKLDIWEVDTFYVEHYDPEVPESLTLLAAHLYYRALSVAPSLIHSWLLDCKDRQLSSAVASYTSQHFSPVLIQAELAQMKDATAMADLVDENLTVKVFSSVNEVLTSYLVDEHQLEIKLKIPSDWPLHKIEVRDVKRVGVDEERWRAWILAVQQTVWSHNGRIIDALSLFKKNVTLHFQGQVECAICYSIISVMDGSLPRKPCKTCKNKFHSSCLLKWFNTSHSSSCPLCRSDIL